MISQIPDFRQILSEASYLPTKYVKGFATIFERGGLGIC